jgi:hypothetical protein
MTMNIHVIIIMIIIIYKVKLFQQRENENCIFYIKYNNIIYGTKCQRKMHSSKYFLDTGLFISYSRNLYKEKIIQI